MILTQKAMYRSLSRIEDLDQTSIFCQMIFNRGAKSIQHSKGNFSDSVEKLDSYSQKNEALPLPRTIKILLKLI